ncbi:hypothetical protein C2G38_2237074 [Gigaspora rosea]|uniref:Uncharacterized protein n=1 Tax=Gigaspora rosea TaxID=44941 RepID=A0A397TNU4_9GLOM|nr:hypothetical protein C2G38_2237074 [Gigaspora rosea]
MQVIKITYEMPVISRFYKALSYLYASFSCLISANYSVRDSKLDYDDDNIYNKNYCH